MPYVDALQWPGVATGFHGVADFLATDEYILEMAPRPERVRNVRCLLKQRKGAVGAILRIALESYDNGDVIAVLPEEPSICAIGSSETEAVENLVEFIMEDFQDLRSYSDDELTEGARKRLAFLTDLLGE